MVNYTIDQEWDLTPYRKELACYEKHHDFFRDLFIELTDKYCPLTLIFYRRNKPKLRKVRKPATQLQNINSYGSVCLLDFNELGTIKRMMKHKGFPDIIGIIDPLPKDVRATKYSSRIIRYTYIHLEEIRIKYSLSDQDIRFLEKHYPSKAFGQLSMYI